MLLSNIYEAINELFFDPSIAERITPGKLTSAVRIALADLYRQELSRAEIDQDNIDLLRCLCVTKPIVASNGQIIYPADYERLKDIRTVYNISSEEPISSDGFNNCLGKLFIKRDIEQVDLSTTTPESIAECMPNGEVRSFLRVASHKMQEYLQDSKREGFGISRNPKHNKNILLLEQTGKCINLYPKDIGIVYFMYYKKWELPNVVVTVTDCKIEIDVESSTQLDIPYRYFGEVVMSVARILSIPFTQLKKD